MSNDLDDDDLNLDDDLGDSFDDFDTKKDGKSLGDLWRDNPLVKIGVIVVVVIIVFFIIMNIGGDETGPETSRVGSAPDMTAVPATNEASQAFIEAIEETNEAAVEQAFQEGTSALPVPIEPPVGVIAVPDGPDDAEDPLQRWRRLQEERLQREMNQRENLTVVDPVVTEEAAIQRDETVQALADQMTEQMSLILESRQQGVEVSTQTMTDPEYLQRLAQAREDEAQEAALALQQSLEESALESESTERLLLSAGEIEYAQLLIEANSDVPGPVLAEIASGPLKGNRIIGSFEVQNDQYLTLTFDTIVIDGESYSIDAIALDPATSLPGMATEVDHRYFQRIVLPAAAAFVEGMAGAIADSGRTTITVTGETVATEEQDASNDQEVASGVEELGEELGEILDDIADDVQTLVRIEAGTPIGIFFIEPVSVGDDADLELTE